MTPVRRAFLARLLHGREIIAAGGLTAFGLWLGWLGGYVLVPLGLALLVLGLAWTIAASRRMRFAQGVEAPGVVDLDEAQIGYLGPEGGGYVALPELVELRLLRVRGRRLWQLRQGDGQALLIPVEAAGADRLFDAFASLPGLDMAALLAALAPQREAGPGIVALTSVSRTIWRRPPHDAPKPGDAG